jgi:serine/threonine protein phosphatase 1
MKLKSVVEFDVHAYPGFPFEGRIYVVGDIHGRLDLLDRILARIDQDRAIQTKNGVQLFDLEIYLGDYLDRGPRSSDVITRLIARSATSRCAFLRGNHERVFQDVLDGKETIANWRKIGGYETILSYGLDPQMLANMSYFDAAALLNGSIPTEHRHFLDGLRNSLHLEPYFFAHAGIRPGIQLDQQSEQDLHWIRGEFLNSKADFGAIIVHGHTPSENLVFRHNRIGIDTGAFATNRLSCLRIDHNGVFVMTSQNPL